MTKKRDDHFRSTGNGMLDVVAACYRLAVRDAQRGHSDAVIFLDSTAPDWQRFVASKPNRTRTREPVREGQNIQA